MLRVAVLMMGDTVSYGSKTKKILARAGAFTRLGLGLIIAVGAHAPFSSTVRSPQTIVFFRLELTMFPSIVRSRE